MIAFLQNLVEPATNAPQVAAIFTQLLKVKISKTTLVKELEEHPDYPSLLSISDVLTNYKIENLAVKLDPASFSKMDEPFLTQIKGKDGSTDYFTVVKTIEGGQAIYFDPEKKKWGTLPLAKLIEQSTGVVLLADAASAISEKNYQAGIQKERTAAILRYATLLAFPVLVFLAWIKAFALTGTAAVLPAVYSFLLLSGTIISVLLLWYELDQYNPLLQQICKPGKKIHCGAVLQSKGATILGISWSAIGFIYFTGGQLLLLFAGITNTAAFSVLGAFSVVAVLYTLFSVFYQWRVAKQWCLLCLIIQGILVLQAVIAFNASGFSVSFISSVLPGMLLPIAIAYALPAIALIIVLPALKKAKEHKEKVIELQRLKHDPRIFEALLSKQKAMVQLPEGLGIVLGSADPTHTIVKVCNPYCGPCAKAHVHLEELLRNYPELQVRIIFMATANDSRTPPVRHLMAIAQTNPDQAFIKEALNDWYLSEQKDYAQFAALYPMNGELKMQDAKLEAMYHWCTEQGVAYTPAIFMDGYQLPGIYTLHDLKYLLTVSH